MLALFSPGGGQVRDAVHCCHVPSLQYCTRPGLPGPGVAARRRPPGGQETAGVAEGQDPQTVSLLLLVCQNFKPSQILIYLERKFLLPACCLF